MSRSTDDVRIGNARPLITPWVLADELPLPDSLAEGIADARRTIENILANKDPRVLAIVGPCSVHDPAALLDFARQFQALDHGHPRCQQQGQGPREAGHARRYWKAPNL